MLLAKPIEMTIAINHTRKYGTIFMKSNFYYENARREEKKKKFMENIITVIFCFGFNRLYGHVFVV